jgi:hypothetical protein
MAIQTLAFQLKLYPLYSLQPSIRLFKTSKQHCQAIQTFITHPVGLPLTPSDSQPPCLPVRHRRKIQNRTDGGVAMRIITLGMLWTCLFGNPTMVVAQMDSHSDIEQLRSELAAIRAEYESRIGELERRLDKAEQEVVVAQQKTEELVSNQAQMALPPASSAASKSGNSDNAFNPALGVIFQGQAWAYENDPDDYMIPGFPLGGEAGPLPQGLALGETEVNISANVDDKFTAWLTVPIAIEDGEAGIEIEEAWIETMGLPAGLTLRLGRHFANIGYLNEKHAHSWDFADQPLPYQAFLGGQYIDDGIGLRWLAPTDIYLELSAEINRGANYPAAGAGKSGFGSYAFHARTGGDIGFSHSWQAGVSYLQADAEQRASGDEDDPLYFSGQSDLRMVEFVWKWAPNGNIRQSNFKLSAEYLWRNEDGIYDLPDGQSLSYDTDQQGWYLQAVYQPIPRWRVGLRWDQLSSQDTGSAFDGTVLMPLTRDPRRYSIMADWSNSEFSRLRLQYSLDQAGFEDDQQWGLQYIFSIGAHGAHAF